MKTSQAGLKFIAQNEGTVLHVYLDSRGLPTIGVGHLIRPGEQFTTITEQQALDLLAIDVGNAEHAVNSNVTVELTQNQFDCCVDFTFNCGGGAFASSTFLKKINAGDVQGAADSILMWDKPREIMGRRHRERTLFLTPDPNVAPEQTPPVPSPPIVASPAPTPPNPAPVAVTSSPPSTPVFQTIIDTSVNLFRQLGKKRY